MINEHSWEGARKNGRRIFFESATNTVRMCPENYCLVHRAGDRWTFYPYEGMVRQHQANVERIIRAFSPHIEGPALADALEIRLR